MMDAHITYKIIPDLRLVINVYNGSISMSDVIKNNRDYINDDLYDPADNVLNDFKSSTALAFKPDVSDFFKFLKNEVTLIERKKLDLY